MRSFLKGLATISFGVGVLVALVSSLVLFSGGSSSGPDTLLTVGASLSSLLLGAVWLLADIAASLARNHPAISMTASLAKVQ
jgi:hypothetical protein